MHVDVACWYILYLKIISGCWVTYLMFSGEKGFIVDLTQQLAQSHWLHIFLTIYLTTNTS